MSTLPQVPPVGVNTDFIRDQPMCLSIEAGYMGGEDTITFEDGTPFLSIQRDLLSARHRIHFIDTRTDSKLFEMTKERFRYEYSAEHPDGSGNSLFEIQIDAAFMGGPTCYIQFANVANGGSPVGFELKMHTFDKTNTILWEGQPIAEFERASLRSHSSLKIAPLVDPLPIVAMLMALTDKARKQKKGKGSIGGNSGFYTSNMGSAGWQGATLGAAGGSV